MCSSGRKRFRQETEMHGKCPDSFGEIKMEKQEAPAVHEGSKGQGASTEQKGMRRAGNFDGEKRKLLLQGEGRWIITNLKTG